MAEVQTGTIKEWGGARYVFLGGNSKDKTRWVALPTPEEPANVPSFKKSYQQELASRSPLEKYNAGWGILPEQAYYGGKDLLSRILGGSGLNAGEQQQVEGYKQLGSTVPGFLGNMSANVAAMGPVYAKALSVPAGASMAPVDVGARALSGGILGATQGALTSPGERAQGAESGFVGGTLGQMGGEYLNARAQQKIAASLESQAQNALRDQVTKEAQAAGFKIPPAQSNPTVANRAMGGIVGKATIPQMASTQNEKVVQRLAAKAVDLPTVTPANVAAARKEAGQAYEALRKYGSFTADDEFVRNVAQIGSENVQTSKIIPGLLNEKVQDLSKVGGNLGGQVLDSNAAISTINRLRSQARINFKSNDAGAVELASAQRKVADELEALIERSLPAGSSLLENFRAARTRLAKLNLIDEAMNEATGKVNPLIIGKHVQAGEPITGELKIIGDMALTYPSAVQQNVKGNIGLPYSALDLGLGLLGSATGAAVGGPAGGYMGAGLALSRPVLAGAQLAGQRWLGTPSYLSPVPIMRHPLLGSLTTAGALEAGRK